jgi:hypothetical protein
MEAMPLTGYLSGSIPMARNCMMVYMAPFFNMVMPMSVE